MTVPGPPVGLLPRRLRRAHVAAALHTSLDEARYLLDSGRLETVQYQRGAWRETTPEALIRYAARMGYALDWGAVLELIDEVNA